jgi:hypothetical protein
MKVFRIIGILGLTLGLAACGSQDLASRNATPDAPVFGFAAKSTGHPLVMSSQYHVVGIEIDVPRSLAVSEANSYYPQGDIVWRGEARGDRYIQVGAIFKDAFAAGTAHMLAGPEVIVSAKVIRFHAVSEKTRYTIGGVYNMVYELSVRSAQTGEIIDGPRKVLTDVMASGGSAAIEEEQRGLTQRVVVVDGLRKSIRKELSKVETEMPMSRNTPIPLTPDRLMEQAPLPL